MATQAASTAVANNGRRQILVAPTVEGGNLLLKFIPIWIGSAVINVSLIAGAYLLFQFIVARNPVDPPTEAEVVATTEVEENTPEKDLTNEDMGIDSETPLNYNVDRIENVSVPGKVDPTASVGIEGAPPGPPSNVPPPPGSGGGTGKAIVDPDNPGTGSMFGTAGGMGGPLGAPGGFGGRSGSTRVKMVQEGGGNARSEAAVANGLKFLALHQAPDGHWGLHNFNRYARTAALPAGKIKPDGSTPGTARRNDTAGTAFGVLPFLAAGITHKGGKAKVHNYTKTVFHALNWLSARQVKSGTDRGFFGGDAYAHGLATIAMCEAYGLTSDPRWKASAQLGLNYIANAQDSAGGGWRYSPRTAGDTSVTGWMLMALKSGQMSGLSVPRIVLRRCEKFLDSVESSSKGGYGYVAGSGESYTMTAVGLLCRQYLGVNPRNPGLLAGVRRLKASGPGKTDNLYYEYYATQVMHHMGGEHWQFWNLGPKGNGAGGIRDTLINKQDMRGKPGNQGSFPPGGADAGGRMMSTSLSLLTLEVYYRHLPLYRRDVGVMKNK
jgi:hypothetical protein